jgi:uncharacterized protein
MSERETRTTPMEVRAIEEGGRRFIGGTCMVYNEWSDDLGGFREIIEGNAADGALDPDMVVCGNHDPNFVLGRMAARTAEFTHDQRGLHYRAEVNEADPLAVSMFEKVKRGDIRGSSFTFMCGEDRWESDETGTRRIITRISWLGEGGPVTFPAYPTTTTQARAIADRLTEARTLEAAGEDAAPIMAALAAQGVEARVGKVLSTANFGNLERARDLITGVLDSATDQQSKRGDDAADGAGEAPAAPEPPAKREGSTGDTHALHLTARMRERA